MDDLKKQYEKPEMTNQGSIVAQTRATKHGENWDGSPYEDDDTKKGDISFEF